MAALLFCLAAVAQSQTAEQPTAAAGRRVALIAGNQNYSKLPPLTAGAQEVAQIRAALKNAGFAVTEVSNATLAELAKALEDFPAQVQPGDTCLFYYSGYAVQAEDTDLLLPVDFDPALPLHNHAYPVTRLAKNLEIRHAGLKLFFLEGARRIEASLPDATLPGLLIPDTGDLTEILFAIPAAANQAVETPKSQPGLFTSALARLIDRKGLSLSDLMPELLKTVMAGSNNQQQPVAGMKITRRFYFHEPEVVRAVEIPRQNHTDREFYVWIPAAKFLMGCVPADTKCEKNEKPQHEVTLSKPFWMGQNEVRVSSYQLFVSASKKAHRMPPGPFWDKKWERDDRPISGMSWEDAAAYCGWAGGRLPTEAEWEYAARAGKPNEVYPLDSENSRDKANFAGKKGNDIFEYTAPVRKFDANGFQLYDMAGNVWEFVNDWYSADYYASSPAVDPKGPDEGKQHVRRGGSFFSDPKKHLRISIREPSNAENNVGFRCVLGDTPETRRLLQNP